MKVPFMKSYYELLGCKKETIQIKAILVPFLDPTYLKGPTTTLLLTLSREFDIVVLRKDICKISRGGKIPIGWKRSADRRGYIIGTGRRRPPEFGSKILLEEEQCGLILDEWITWPRTLECQLGVCVMIEYCQYLSYFNDFVVDDLWKKITNLFFQSFN